MGAVQSCFGVEDSEVVTPDPEVKRQQMLEAAEKRKRESEERGLKNPQRVKEQQKKKLAMEKMSSTNSAGGNMRWQVG